MYESRARAWSRSPVARRNEASPGGDGVIARVGRDGVVAGAVRDRSVDEPDPIRPGPDQLVQDLGRVHELGAPGGHERVRGNAALEHREDLLAVRVHVAPAPVAGCGDYMGGVNRRLDSG